MRPATLTDLGPKDTIAASRRWFGSSITTTTIITTGTGTAMAGITTDVG
jgi:hypothetical protein